MDADVEDPSFFLVDQSAWTAPIREPFTSIAHFEEQSLPMPTQATMFPEGVPVPTHVYYKTFLNRVYMWSEVINCKHAPGFRAEVHKRFMAAEDSDIVKVASIVNTVTHSLSIYAKFHHDYEEKYRNQMNQSSVFLFLLQILPDIESPELDEIRQEIRKYDKKYEGQRRTIGHTITRNMLHLMLDGFPPIKTQQAGPNSMIDEHGFSYFFVPLAPSDNFGLITPGEPQTHVRYREFLREFYMSVQSTGLPLLDDLKLQIHQKLMFAKETDSMKIDSMFTALKNAFPMFERVHKRLNSNEEMPSQTTILTLLLNVLPEIRVREVVELRAEIDASNQKFMNQGNRLNKFVVQHFLKLVVVACQPTD